MPAMQMVHEADPRDVKLKELGNIKDVEIFNNQVLVAVYLRPEKTKSGIYLPDQNRAEDQYQSKVGLVVKLGPDAFVDSSGAWFKNTNISLHDWVVFRPSDGWNLTVNGVLCRILDDTAVRGRVQSVDSIW